MTLDEFEPASVTVVKPTASTTVNHLKKDSTQSFSDSESDDKFGRQQLENSIQMTIHNTLNSLTKSHNGEFLWETIKNALHADLPPELSCFEAKSSLFEAKKELIKQKNMKTAAGMSNTVDINLEKLRPTASTPVAAEEDGKHKTLGSLVNSLIVQNVPNQVESLSDVDQEITKTNFADDSVSYAQAGRMFSMKRKSGMLMTCMTNSTSDSDSVSSIHSESSCEKSPGVNESSQTIGESQQKESKLWRDFSGFRLCTRNRKPKRWTILKIKTI